MTLSMIIMLLCLPVLLVCSAFFSGSETALFSLSQHEKLRLGKSRSLAARAITALIAEQRGLLITLLLGNMTINVIYFVISSELVIQFGEAGLMSAAVLTGFTMVPLLAIILFGEVLPKLLASRMTLFFATLIAVPLMIVHRVLTPIRVASQFAVITPLARLFSPDQPAPLSVEELDALLELSQHHGVIDQAEEQVLQQALDLRELKVTQLMTPRVDVVAFDLRDEPARLIEILKEKRPRLLPVCRGSLDQIVGVIYARQALLQRPTTREQVRKLVRQVKFVPEQQHADRLLLELRRTGSTMAIVADEYGGTAGVVTLQDVVSMLVGDIPENGSLGLNQGPEQDQPEVIKVSEGVWRCDARLSVREWLTLFKPRIARKHVDAMSQVSTLGGLFMVLADRVPQEGDLVEFGNLRLTVVATAGRSVTHIRVELIDTAKEVS